MRKLRGSSTWCFLFLLRWHRGAEEAASLCRTALQSLSQEEVMRQTTGVVDQSTPESRHALQNSLQSPSCGSVFTLTSCLTPQELAPLTFRSSFGGLAEILWGSHLLLYRLASKSDCIFARFGVAVPSRSWIISEMARSFQKPWAAVETL